MIPEDGRPSPLVGKEGSNEVLTLCSHWWPEHGGVQVGPAVSWVLNTTAPSTGDCPNLMTPNTAILSHHTLPKGKQAERIMREELRREDREAGFNTICKKRIYRELMGGQGSGGHKCQEGICQNTRPRALHSHGPPWNCLGMSRRQGWEKVSGSCQHSGQLAWHVRGDCWCWGF